VGVSGLNHVQTEQSSAEAMQVQTKIKFHRNILSNNIYIIDQDWKTKAS